MMLVAIFGFIVGSGLAARFSAWILIPATILASIAGISFELLDESSLSSSIKIGLLLGLSPQIGYVIGLIAREVFAAFQNPANMKQVPGSARWGVERNKSVRVLPRA